MEAKLKQLVARENKRNPLTDLQLAEALSGRREEITLLRNELGIPDSRERRREQLFRDAAEIVSSTPRISARTLTFKLQAMGYEISRHVAGQLLKELTAGKPKPERKTSLEPGAYANLIGWEGSLRTQIQQAKAAVIYPPAGLHTLILGESGVGKSELAEAMYRYSLEAGQRGESSPFVVFNCADYAENPQLLISQLFGHVRGAFTGAAEDKAGLVEKADGGFLFLDEIHRLPPEGQEILYAIIDRGCYRRLGETDPQRKVDLMLIAATTEDPESSLLTPFRRRIPMVIELPPLRSRPLTERMEIALHFFNQEANRVGKKLVVQRDVLKALMSGDKRGNVGQIKSDVQVACARGFLNHFGSQSSEEIVITLNELSANSRQALLSGKDRQELEELLPKDQVFYPGGGEQKAHILRDNIYALPDEIYTRIEELVKEGRRQGLSPEETSQSVSHQLELEFSNIIKRIEKIKPALTRLDLEKLVGPELTEAMTEMVDLAGSDLDLDSEQLFFYLSIHLYTVLERIRYGKPIVNPQLTQVKKEHEQEYLTAVKMAAVVKRRFGLSLPDDEIGFIALYLRTFLNSNRPDDGRVAVLVLSHGRVAQEMVNVVHALLRENHAYSLDMALTESPEVFLQRVLVKAREIDQGKGILLLVDMGSLVTFGEIIEKELGIHVRVLDRVDVVMVLEATRWSMLAGASLDEISNDLAISKATPVNLGKPDQRRQMLVAVCLSGVGGAEKIRAYLDAHLDDTGVEIKTIGVIDEPRLKRKLEEWQKNYRLTAVVGTINPEIPGVPFLPFQSVTASLGMDYLRSLLTQRQINRPRTAIISRDMIFTKTSWQDKAAIIEHLGEVLVKQGYVKPGYIESVFEREDLAPTCIEGGIAIPHADPEFVLKPGIAVATLEKPIIWWGLEVDVVFLLALRVTDRQLFANLLKVFRNKEKMHRIRSAQTAVVIEEEIIDVIS